MVLISLLLFLMLLVSMPLIFADLMASALIKLKLQPSTALILVVAIAALRPFLFLPQLAPPVAFAAGVFGPLVGADLMHVREFAGITTGIASIGGVGTFDGIVFSAILAAYLA